MASKDVFLGHPKNLFYDPNPKLAAPARKRAIQEEGCYIVNGISHFAQFSIRRFYGGISLP
jgi:hypothetical protein